MSAVNILAGIAFTAMLGGVIVAWWRGHKDLFSFLFVACIATLAIAFNNARVGQHNDRKAVMEAAVQGSTGSTAPLAGEIPYAGAP
jgi:hypothetical protein